MSLSTRRFSSNCPSSSNRAIVIIFAFFMSPTGAAYNYPYQMSESAEFSCITLQGRHNLGREDFHVTFCLLIGHPAIRELKNKMFQTSEPAEFLNLLNTIVWSSDQL